MKQCPRCQKFVPENTAYCSNCGYAFGSGTQTPPPAGNDNPFDSCPEGKSRGVAALLAILLGYLGVHYFYLGKTTAGIISLVLGLCSCGIWGIITLIQGIMMFCMTNEQFRQKYVLTNSSFPLF